MKTLKQYEVHINNISDYLYYKNVTRTKDPAKADALYKEILFLLEKQDAELKKLLAQEPAFPIIESASIVD